MITGIIGSILASIIMFVIALFIPNNFKNKTLYKIHIYLLFFKIKPQNRQISYFLTYNIKSLN